MEGSWLQVPCARTVSAGFDNTALDFLLSVGVPDTVNFKRSFFRVDMSLYDGSGNSVPLKPQALTAFADNAIGNLFNACSVSGGEQTLSKLDQNVAQISALKSRLSNTSAWVKSMGKTALHESSFQKRLLAVTRSPAENAATPTLTQSSMTGLASYDDREIYRPYAAAAIANFATAAVAIADTGIVTGSAECNFLIGMPLGANAVGGSVLPGDILIANGVSYNIVADEDAARTTTATRFVVSPAPPFAIAATTNWFIVRPDMIRAEQGFNRITADWQPPLGIFEYDDVLGPGNYTLSLTPNSDYARTAIETKDPNWRLGAPYRLVIDNVRFYAYISKMSIAPQVKDITFREMKMYSKLYSESLQYTVPDTTYALSLFIQDPLAGYSPLIPPSMFKVLNDNGDLFLKTLSIDFGGMTKPDAKWESDYVPAVTTAGAITTSPLLRLQQRYHDTYAESGLDVELAGAESFNDYLRRGPFYHFVYQLDAANRATQVVVNTTFDAPLGKPASIEFCKMILVAHYLNPVQIITKDGIIRDVKNRFG